MEFYKQMLIHFFDVNHLTLDILDLCEELDVDRCLQFILETIRNGVTEKEIEEYCYEEQGMEEEDVKVCLEEIRNGGV